MSMLLTAMTTAAILLHPIKHKPNKQNMGMTDANIVAIFLAVVVLMTPFARSVSNVLLMKILKNHKVRKGVAVNTAFSLIWNFKTPFM